MATALISRGRKPTTVPITDFKPDPEDLRRPQPPRDFTTLIPDLPRQMSDGERVFVESRRNARNEVCAFLLMTPCLIDRIEQHIGGNVMCSLDANISVAMQAFLKSSSREVYIGTDCLMLHHSGMEILPTADLKLFLAGQWPFEGPPVEGQHKYVDLLKSVKHKTKPEGVHALYDVYAPILARKFKEEKKVKAASAGSK